MRVVYVTVPSAMGGSNQALVTLLAAIDPLTLTRVVAGPGVGALHEIVESRNLAETYVPRRRVRRFRRLGRMAAAGRLAVWVMVNRRNISCIHANATTGFYLAAPAAIVTRVPLVIWVHDSVSTPWGRRLGPHLRRLIGKVRWVAVSPVAAEVIVANGLSERGDITVVPNPIDPDEVRAHVRHPSSDGRIRIGFLGAPTSAKGFDLIPGVARLLDPSEVVWNLYVSRGRGAFQDPVWQELDSLGPSVVNVVGRMRDVRHVYAECDIVFNPSRSESFSRVTAEALINGLPVVGSDIPPIRTLLDDSGSGLLFPVGKAEEAAESIRRVIRNPSQFKLGQFQSGDFQPRDSPVGPSEYDPARIAASMISVYREVSGE